MYYRGDDFGANPQVPDQPIYDPGFTESIQFYANTPDSAIRAAELKAGEDVATSGFTGGGGFLKQQLENLKVVSAFFSPFVPFIAPAILGTGAGAAAAAAITKAENLGGALRPTIEAITTATGGTTTATGATGSAPSRTPSTALPPKPSTSSTPAEVGAPEALFLSSLAASGLLPAQGRPTSLGTRRWRPPSRTQQRAFLAAVQRQLRKPRSPRRPRFTV